MKDCKKYQELIIKLISSGLDTKEKEILDSHTVECHQCAEFLLIHQKLEQNQRHIPIPNPDEFKTLRQKTLRKIRLSESLKMGSLWDRKTGLFGRVEFAYGLAAVLLILSVYLSFDSNSQQATMPSGLIEQIDYTAIQHTSLTDIENSPYTYSDIQIKELGDNQISLGFNVSTYIELSRDKNDPLVKEILAQSIINSQQTGMRLSTISYAEEIIDPKLKETLIFVLLNDLELAVRLKALDVLTKYSKDNQIQEAFISVLKNEESVQMRLSVLDYLMSNQVDASLIVKELSEATTRINSPVLIKAQEYIQYKNNN